MQLLKRLFLISILLIISSVVHSRDVQVFDESYHIKGDRMEFRLDMDGGELRIEPNSVPDECAVYMRYNKEKVDTDVDFDPKNNNLEVRIDQRGLKLDSDDVEKGKWVEVAISLPTDPLIEFYTKIKAGDVDLELGGLKLTDFELHNWAGDINVDFDEPNPVKMEYFEVNVKAGDVELRHLGNLNFAEADINGGIGELTLDFRGQELQKALARIDLDIGETRVIVPYDLGVKLKVTKFLFLTNVDLPDQFKRHRRFYYSENYDEADRVIYLRVSPGIGEFQLDVD